MGLPARQRKVLQRIENALRGSDPKLAALYTIFARLNRDEEMPRAEQLRHSVVVALTALRRLPAVMFGWLHLRLIPRQRAILFLPLALLIAVASIAYAATSSPGGTCVPVRSVASAKVTAKSRLCRPPVLSPAYAGH